MARQNHFEVSMARNTERSIVPAPHKFCQEGYKK